MAKNDVAEHLQDMEPYVMTSWSLYLRQIDPPVTQVGNRTRGQRQVRHVVQLKTEVFGHLDHDALGERAAMVIDGLENLLGGRFDLGVVVASFAHLCTKFRIGTARFFWRCRVLARSAHELLVQADRVPRGLRWEDGDQHGHRGKPSD